MTPTLVTVKFVPGYPNAKAKLKSVPIEPDVTWYTFFQLHGMELDPLNVKVKSSKADAFLDQTVGHLMSNYKRKGKIVVSVEQLKKPRRRTPRSYGNFEAVNRVQTMGDSIEEMELGREVGTSRVNNRNQRASAREFPEGFDDDLSQCSQDPTAETTGDILVKQNYMQFFEQLRPGVFREMREELQDLKLSGELRYAKWRHYAPLLSSMTANGFPGV